MRERGQSYRGVEDDGIDIRAVIGALRRRKAIIWTTIAVVTASAVLTTLLIAPRYTATAALMIKPSELRIVDMKAVAEGLPPTLAGDSSTIATQIKVLTSRTSAERIVRKLELMHDPEFNHSVLGESTTKRITDWLSEKWLVATGLADHNTEADERTEPQADREARGEEGALEHLDEEILARVVDRFLDVLTVSRDGESDVILVSFTSTDPKKATQIANALVASYTNSQMETKVQETARAAEWLLERSQQLRGQVLQAETAVEAYRAANDLINGRGGSLDGQQLASLNEELIGARAERMAREAKLRQVRQMREKGEGYELLTEVASSPIITNLRQREAQLLADEAQLSEEYGAKHPLNIQAKAERERLAQKIHLEMSNVVSTLEDELTIARSREQALQESLEGSKKQSALAGHAAIQLRELEREAEAKRAVYEAFLARLREIQEQRDLLKPDAEVISFAVVPDDASFPDLRTITIIGLVTSLILGLSLAGLAEHMDRGVRTAHQVEQVLEVPSLGLVPKIERLPRRQRPHHYLLEKPLSAYAEAIKEIHTALHTPDFDVSPQVVLVTSTLPGEGKTTFAMSLGASFARSGYRTLVMDLDLRHSSMARELDQAVHVGLVEFMIGKFALKQIIWEDPRERNLHIIPVVARVRNPSDLLRSEAMQSLIAELRDRYDYIVLDAPPALGTADTKVAAQLADAVIFIVRWQTTPASSAENGLRALIKSHISVAGVVLTQVNLRRHKGYGYGDVAEYYGTHKEYYSS